uniref:Uncharacterized protein n=1 Tax=Arundo donax TaxID=35708 RepID=A0A0A8Z7C6_ARUDO
MQKITIAFIKLTPNLGPQKAQRKDRNKRAI